MLYLIKITEWKKDSRYKNKIKHINKTKKENKTSESWEKKKQLHLLRITRKINTESRNFRTQKEKELFYKYINKYNILKSIWVIFQLTASSIQKENSLYHYTNSYNSEQTVQMYSLYYSGNIRLLHLNIKMFGKKKRVILEQGNWSFKLS